VRPRSIRAFHPAHVGTRRDSTCGSQPSPESSIADVGGLASVALTRRPALYFNGIGLAGDLHENLSHLSSELSQ
jgi:hypothetical protein